MTGVNLEAFAFENQNAIGDSHTAVLDRVDVDVVEI
jgi:hypothetical protein